MLALPGMPDCNSGFKITQIQDIKIYRGILEVIQHTKVKVQLHFHQITSRGRKPTTNITLRLANCCFFYA